MKENTKKGSCYLNGLAIFLSIIFVISIFMAADNAIPLQAATVKKYLAVSVMSVKMVLVRNVREIRKRQLVLMVLQRLSELRRIHAVR